MSAPPEDTWLFRSSVVLAEIPGSCSAWFPGDGDLWYSDCIFFIQKWWRQTEDVEAWGAASEEGEGGCKAAMRHWPLINFCIVGESFNIKDDLIETRAREDEVRKVKYHVWKAVWPVCTTLLKRGIQVEVLLMSVVRFYIDVICPFMGELSLKRKTKQETRRGINFNCLNISDGTMVLWMVWSWSVQLSDEEHD